MEAHFSHIESQLCQYIKKADKIYICSAWFSSRPILDALATREAEIIVSDWTKLTLGHFDYDDKLVTDILRSVPETFLFSSSQGLMHHKFMILCHYHTFGTQPVAIPYAIITGSYNYTYSATTNHENILYVENEALGEEYLREFYRLKQLSIRLQNKAQGRG